MGNPNTQILFFQQIRSVLPAHISFVDEVAELLNISNDSAYRRIRAEKAISFDELQVLCNHYKISLDHFLHLQSDVIIFSGNANTESESRFDDYLKMCCSSFSG